jgi:hypothetical protein
VEQDMSRCGIVVGARSILARKGKVFQDFGGA